MTIMISIIIIIISLGGGMTPRLEWLGLAGCLLAWAPLQAQQDDKREEKIIVRGASQKAVLEKSSRDVTVIDTQEAKARAADTGEVLARTQGVAVRRTGGLGSEERFSLNGLSDDRIRFFIDGVPLSLVGYDFGLSNVPLNFMKRIEIYRGVVPIQFGADALGGAINLVTDNSNRADRWTSSLTLGSFQTIRGTWGAQARSGSGWIVRGSGFSDYAGNDYPVTAKVPDASGRPQKKSVKRFHDRYRARGFGLETGVAQKDWAEELMVRVFHSKSEKELQSNTTMSVPYGEAVRGSEANGISVRYVQPLSDSLRLDSVTGYSANAVYLRDLSLCVYDWYGNCKNNRQIAGEIVGRPQDVREKFQSAYTRINNEWIVDDDQRLRFTFAATLQQRQGEDGALTDPTAFDRLTLKRSLETYVLGVEHEVHLLDEHLENTLFLKGYQQNLATEKSPFVNASFQNERATKKSGWGDSLGFEIGAGFFTKLSFEQAIRLPSSDEIFGDGVQILSNMDLAAETSTNTNLSLTFETPKETWGKIDTGLGLFLRDTRDLILMVGSSDQAFVYLNVYDARAQGYEVNLQWSSPQAHSKIVLNATSLDNRNQSKDGPFAIFYRDRIPNQPYFFANSNLSFRWPETLGGLVDFAWNTRYAGEYFRTWESLSSKNEDDRIPEQISHSASVGYSQKSASLEYSLNFEIQNLTDQKIFDVFGLERPGRAYFVKTSIDL